MKPSGRVHITSTSDLKSHKKIFFETIKSVEKEIEESPLFDPLEKSKRAKEYEGYKKSSEEQRKSTVRSLLKAFEPIAIEHCECIECDFEWTATLFSSRLLGLIYSEDDVKSLTQKRHGCPYCKFKPPLILYALMDFKKNTYIPPLVDALERLALKRDHAGAIIFACISLEVFLAEVARYQMKQLETDPKIIEFFIDDASPLISTYSKLFKKLKIGISKDLDRMRELSDIRNDIVHRNKRDRIWKDSDIEKPLLKLADFFRTNNQYHPRYCPSYDFWLDPATGDIFLTRDGE